MSCILVELKTFVLFYFSLTEFEISPSFCSAYFEPVNLLELSNLIIREHVMNRFEKKLLKNSRLLVNSAWSAIRRSRSNISILLLPNVKHVSIATSE